MLLLGAGQQQQQAWAPQQQQLLGRVDSQRRRDPAPQHRVWSRGDHNGPSPRSRSPRIPDDTRDTCPGQRARVSPHGSRAPDALVSAP